MKIGPLRTSRIEIRDLFKAWLAISIAFAIIITGLSFTFYFLAAILISAITVGLGFLFHELAHKITAQHYGCFAEFRSFDTMLILAIIMSFFGFVLAAPGGVFIQGQVGIARNGRISAAGPLTNMVIAVIFLLLILLTPLKTIAFYGFIINSWLALFNMLPFGNFDGIKILRWNKTIYALMIIFAGALMFAQYYI